MSHHLLVLSLGRHLHILSKSFRYYKVNSLRISLLFLADKLLPRTFHLKHLTTNLDLCLLHCPLQAHCHTGWSWLHSIDLRCLYTLNMDSQSNFHCPLLCLQDLQSQFCLHRHLLQESKCHCICHHCHLRYSLLQSCNKDLC